MVRNLSNVFLRDTPQQSTQLSEVQSSTEATEAPGTLKYATLLDLLLQKLERKVIFSKILTKF